MVDIEILGIEGDAVGTVMAGLGGDGGFGCDCCCGAILVVAAILLVVVCCGGNCCCFSCCCWFPSVPLAFAFAFALPPPPPCMESKLNMDTASETASDCYIIESEYKKE